MLLPIIALISACIWLVDGAPVFYGHRRIGRNGRVFSCLKFRSMARGSDVLLSKLLASDVTAQAEWEISQKLKNDPRIIPGIGHFLRRSSLDELPQLFNVFKGEMSLVGPRPVTDLELGNYGEYLDYYLSLRPGITGLWQISGRSEIGYEQRVRLDASYATQMSAGVDLRIMISTLPVVLFSRGAYVLMAIVTLGGGGLIAS